ncbi:ABC transporter permease subunit [Falsigemmobacter faecalis]|uniref:ABC transporter permease subunit n=2 Tax=Falsigemmobacter faecalis TaxID=2488730 RepID=A0A3P3DX44_9RHOB|nr:ABC transporter permease subunit [Falsigemmobacter faecalis]
MLLYDTRYRSFTLQFIALVLVALAGWWLVANTVANLKALGKDFSFGFLTVRSGYDINQRLIEYTSDSSHGRAMLVGLLNTLLLAALSCVTATIVGVFAGVLRLSENWLISRLIGFYVEIFRNIPLVLWILLIFAVMTESMPPPNAFRGENATSSMLFFDSVAITNRGVYVPEPLFDRSLGNIDLGVFLVSIDLLAIIAVLSVCFWAWRRLKTQASAVQNATGVRPTTWWKSILIFVVPLVALKLALGFHLGMPELRGFNFAGGTYMRNSFFAMWVALTLYTGAFIAETVRGGILAISRGQSEAAFALGLRPGRTMSLVILPQALRVIIPPMISQYLNITKNTSLALAVGYMDLRATLGGITINQTGRELEGMLLLMLTYLVISLIISMVMNWYNARVRLKER